MATSFGGDVITASLPYWYSRLPYTARVSLTAGNPPQALFGPVIGWNSQRPSPESIATLETLASARDPALQFTVQADSTTLQLYSASHPPGYQPVPVEARARQTLSLTAQNPLTITTMPSGVLYTVSVFRLPLTWKLLLDYPITSPERATAEALGLDVSPVTQNGQYPIPIRAVIERTYANRQYASPLVYDGPAITFSGAGSTTLTQFDVPPNALYVLRQISCPIDADYGPAITVDRDTDTAFLQLDPSAVPGPIDAFVPALSRLQIHVSVTTPPPGPVPIRVVVWRLSLSNLLRLRLGLLDEPGLVEVFQAGVQARAAAQHRTATPKELESAAAAAAAFAERVRAGVI